MTSPSKIACNNGDSTIQSVSDLQDMARFPEENPYPVMRVRHDGVVCYANSASQCFLAHWNIQLGGIVPGVWLARVSQALETGKLTRLYETVETTTYSLVLVPLSDQQHVNIYGQDISRLKCLLQRLRQTRASLQHTVASRTAQLHQTVKTLMSEVRDRLQAETELRENQRRLTEAQRIAQIGSWEWNLDHKTLWWSDQVYRIFGRDPESFSPSEDHLFQSVHPEDRPRLQNAIDHAIQNNSDFVMEHRIVLPDQKDRIVLGRGEIHTHETDGSRIFRGTVQDITATREHVTLIKDQSDQIEKQTALLDAAHDMISVFDLDGRIIYWNRGAERTYGWTRAQAQGEIGYELLKTEFTPSRSEIISHILHQGQWEGELVQRCQRGQRLCVESRWVLQANEQHRPEAILSIERDVTARKQAETEVKKARDYAESIIATIQDALIVLNEKLEVMSANDSFYQTFDATQDDVVGRPIYHLPGGQWHCPELRQLLEEILPHNTQLRNYELTYSVPDTEPRYLLLNARRVFQKTGSQELILLAIQDITERKLQGKAIAAHEMRLHALTEELLKTEETQRDKTALALHDSIGPTLAFAKRELAALEKETSSQWRDNLRRINRQISQAIEQTRSLTMELSPPTLSIFGLEAALEELADDFAREYNLNCETLYSEETIPVAKNHRTFLYRAVRELLINIVKHAEATQVTICIERDHESIEITVEDNGQGFIPTVLVNDHPEHLQGFGLFSIQERLKYIGGRFSVHSNPNQGTRVVLRAPIACTQKGDCQDGHNPTRG